jgi:hypothetical protein
MIKGLDYWYDGQMRRFLAQIIRAFSGFQYRTGYNANGAPQLVMVPCRGATTERMVANILSNGSTNAANAVPMICVYQTGLRGRRDAIQNPNHVSTVQVTERDVDGNGHYTGDRGRSYTVQRLMPRPFEATFNVDLWTSNLDQKHQLVEQIATIFYPDIAIQNSDNPLDWTALTTLHLEDEIQWSSRSVNIGTESEIDVTTFTLRLPFWLSPPAKVQQQKLIEQIIVNIHDGHHDDLPTDENLLTRQIITPGDHCISVENGRITLLGSEAAPHDAEGNIYPWHDLLRLYGTLRPTESTIHLKQNDNLDDTADDIVGSIQIEPSQPNVLIWSVHPETLPANTLAPVDAIIDPRKHFPGEHLDLPQPGQRYLLVHSLSGPSQAWGNLNAHEGAIIQFGETGWTEVFRPTHGDTTTKVYVLNKHTGRQLRWNGFDWVLTIDGEYHPGMWRIDI